MLNKFLVVLYSIVLAFIFIILFPVSSCKKENEKIMKVRNDSISEISVITAKAFATIIDIGTGIEQHGHCWSTNPEPAYENNENKTMNGKVDYPCSYTSNLDNLQPGTIYYIRAYIKKGNDIKYGENILSFNTLQGTLPVVKIGTVNSISTTEATVTGNIEAFGAGINSVSEHGHCWSNTTATPTIINDKTSLGSKDSTGSFASSLVGLSQGTMYYVRAYATNNVGTSYSDTVSFKTLHEISLPTVETASISSISATTAISGGNIISNGGSAITAKGVCWKTSPNPLVSDNKTEDGTGSDSYSSSLTSLASNTTYYVRAYATNSIGTAYGEEVSFTTFEEYLIAYYTLNNTSADITGNCPDMILENAPYTGNSIYCNGIYVLSMDSNYCNVYTPEISSISYDELTFCVEFKIIDTPKYYYPVLVAGAGAGLDRWLGFAVHSDSKFAIHGANFSLKSKSTEEYQINTWYEARLTYDSSISRGDLYINGSLVCTSSFILDLQFAHKSVGITNYSSAMVFKGYLRNLKIYSKVVEP